MTSTQELNELRLWIEGATEGELECRLGHHRFERYQYSPETKKTPGVWTERHRCSRGCGTQTVVEYSKTTGMSLYRYLDYSGCPHYRISGLGRITAEDRGMMRLALLDRQEKMLRQLERVA